MRNQFSIQEVSVTYETFALRESNKYLHVYNSVKAHGHCLVSGNKNELPSWLPKLRGADIIDELNDRVSYVINGIGERLDQTEVFVLLIVLLLF